MADAILRESRISPLGSSLSLIQPEQTIFEPMALELNLFSVVLNMDRVSPSVPSSVFLDSLVTDVSESLMDTEIPSSFVISPQPYNHAVLSSGVYLATYAYSSGEELSFGESNNQQSSAGPQESWHFS